MFYQLAHDHDAALSWRDVEILPFVAAALALLIAIIHVEMVSGAPLLHRKAFEAVAIIGIVGVRQLFVSDLDLGPVGITEPAEHPR